MMKDKLCDIKISFLQGNHKLGNTIKVTVSGIVSFLQKVLKDSRVVVLGSNEQRAWSVVLVLHIIQLTDNLYKCSFPTSLGSICSCLFPNVLVLKKNCKILWHEPHVLLLLCWLCLLTVKSLSLETYPKGRQICPSKKKIDISAYQHLHI